MVDRVHDPARWAAASRCWPRWCAAARASTASSSSTSRRQGYVRVRVNGQLRELTEDIELAKTKKHTIEVVVDRLVVRENLGGAAGRLARDGAAAGRRRRARWRCRTAPPCSSRSGWPARTAASPSRRCRRACSRSTTRYGACPDCGGIGTRYEVDPERVVPDRPSDPQPGRARAVGGAAGAAFFKQTLQVLRERHEFGLDTPWGKLSKKTRATSSCTASRTTGSRAW